MRKFFKTIIIASLALLIGCSEQNEHIPEKPEGFFDYEVFEYDTAAKKYKHEYKEELYYTEGNLNVDSIRLLHMNERIMNRRRSARGFERFANGNIAGEWFERGPLNEAGDMREVDYNPEEDSLYCMSTAGHIWKGSLDGQKWRVLNDQIKFRTEVLNHIEKNGNDRLIALYGGGIQNKIPRYSDNMGKTWNLPDGIGDGFYDGWGRPLEILETNDGQSIFYLVQTWKGSPWGSAIELYFSNDWGESYGLVVSLNGGGYDANDTDLWRAVDQDVFYLIDNDKKKLYTIHYDSNTHGMNLGDGQTINGLGDGQIKITGRYENGATTLYALVAKNTVYKSLNGVNWQNLGQVMINGEVQNMFRSVFDANPLNNDLYMGGFQFYKTSDESSWSEQYSYWWTYYDKGYDLPERKDNMHVDMMEFEFFRKEDGTPFFIILNHAGVYVSYDNMATTTNLGQRDLNVVTLYDHATAPDGTIFFGAQDKGTFRNIANNNNGFGQIESENMTTGDGMRELFFNEGKSWFGFLQNGSMICMPDKSGTTQKWWKVPGDDIPGWINPVENHPDPKAKKCYIAGGNINGGSGSYLIEMTVSWTGDGNDFQWNPSQFNYDFLSNSRDGNAVIKALSASTIDHNRLYVATKDGTFFTSYNAGNNWNKNTSSLPSSLLPWDIVVSQTDANKVFVCGTGWSDEGVWMSTDGGNSFVALNTNSIQATYFDMVLSPDESVLYAATSEGPYAYVFEDNSWYSMGGNETPIVDFRSVEFITSINTVRFGTYGRGVWDFQLQDEPVADCYGTPNGTAYEDACDKCVGGESGIEPCQVPYQSLVIPGVIEAEAFDLGGEGISYHDVTEANEGGQLRLDESVDVSLVNSGGYYLGWTVDGEWVEYTVDVTESGVYTLNYTVASPNNNNQFHLEIDDQPIGSTVSFNTTGGWQQWSVESLEGFELVQGLHVLRLVIDVGAFDLDRLEFIKQTVTSSVTASDNQNRVYPNPVSGGVVYISTKPSTKVSIVSSTGLVLKSMIGRSNYSIAVDDWVKGAYSVKFGQNQDSQIKKLIIR